jgi:hypothetical protein
VKVDRALRAFAVVGCIGTRASIRCASPGLAGDTGQPVQLRRREQFVGLHVPDPVGLVGAGHRDRVALLRQPQRLLGAALRVDVDHRAGHAVGWPSASRMHSARTRTQRYWPSSCRTR